MPIFSLSFNKPIVCSMSDVLPAPGEAIILIANTFAESNSARFSWASRSFAERIFSTIGILVVMFFDSIIFGHQFLRIGIVDVIPKSPVRQSDKSNKLCNKFRQLQNLSNKLILQKQKTYHCFDDLFFREFIVLHPFRDEHFFQQYNVIVNKYFLQSTYVVLQVGYHRLLFCNNFS